MTEYVVSLDEDDVTSLKQSLRLADLQESRKSRRSDDFMGLQIDKFKGLKVEIFSDEHPPPHFRVKFQGATANYRIKDCRCINGSREVVRFEKIIRNWWKANKQKLIDTWNERRPSDCPVGL